MEYYAKANDTNDNKLRSILEVVAKAKDRETLMRDLLAYKVMVGNKSILSSTEQVNYLYDRGFISKAEKALLNAVKYDELTKSFYVDRDYKGFGSGGSGSGDSEGGLTEAKARTLINQVNTAYKDVINSNNKPVKTASAKVSTPKDQTQSLSKVLSVKQKRSGGRLWFTPY